MKCVCPKCGSPNAHYAKTVTDLLLVCFCGYSKVVFTTLKELEAQSDEVDKNVKLPRPGTHLRKTLFAVECLEEATTAEITERLLDIKQAYSASDVASYLTILRSKGLVGAVVIRRGVPGGSTWTLTDAASDLLSLLKPAKVQVRFTLRV